MLKPRETEERRQELLGQRKIAPGLFEEKKMEPEKEEEPNVIHFKVRFDFKGKEKPAKFFFGGKNSTDVARYTRDQQATLWRNVPAQGINILKIEEEEVYDVFDEAHDQEVAYAPLIMEIKVDSLEDLVRFVVREEFRRIDIIEPRSINMSSQALEHLLFKFHQAARDQVFMQIKKLQE